VPGKIIKTMDGIGKLYGTAGSTKTDPRWGGGLRCSLLAGGPQSGCRASPSQGNPDIIAKKIKDSELGASSSSPMGSQASHKAQAPFKLHSGTVGGREKGGGFATPVSLGPNIAWRASG
jgi:hypothetical protein